MKRLKGKWWVSQPQYENVFYILYSPALRPSKPQSKIRVVSTHFGTMLIYVYNTSSPCKMFSTFSVAQSKCEVAIAMQLLAGRTDSSDLSLDSYFIIANNVIGISASSIELTKNIRVSRTHNVWKPLWLLNSTQLSSQLK